MPLIKSPSAKAFKENVGTLMSEVGKSKHVQSRDQALAIAYDVKRRAKRAAGGPALAPPGVRAQSKSSPHAGPVNSTVPGRTDRHNISVKPGSYVLPSSHVASLGQDNTMAGFAAISHMFGQGGPYGVKPMAIKPPDVLTPSMFARIPPECQTEPST